MKSSTNVAKQQGKAGCEGFWPRLVENIVGAHLFGRGLCFVQTVVGYTFGILAGLGVGWLLGGYIGSLHARDIQHAVDFLDFNQLREWQDIPWSFARTGAAAGAIVGLAAIRIIEIIDLNRTIISLCKAEAAEPDDIARLLGRSVRQIRRRMNRLAGKGIIACEVALSPQKAASDMAKRENSPQRLGSAVK